MISQSSPSILQIGPELHQIQTIPFQKGELKLEVSSLFSLQNNRLSCNHKIDLPFVLQRMFVCMYVLVCCIIRVPSPSLELQGRSDESPYDMKFKS